MAGLATAAGTAHAIASNQANKVLKSVHEHRIEDITNSITNDKYNLRLIKDMGSDLDGVRETTTLATHAQTNLNQAISLNNEFAHLVSRSGTVEFSDPSQEVYMNTIKEMNARDTVGLTKAEVGEKTRLSADITTMTTIIIPTRGTSEKCEDRLIMKTIFVPVVNHRSRRVVITKGGKLYPKYGDKPNYILLSRNWSFFD